MLELYFAPGSSSMAVHIALHEIGVPFKPHPVSLRRQDNREAPYLALNPEGKVPVLLIDGRPLTEVAGILFYLARRFPEAGLLAEGVEAEAKAVSWMSFAAATLHPARRHGLDHAMAVWQIADARLAGRDWIMGAYSVVDIHVFRLFWRLNASLRPPSGMFANLSAHHDRMLARPAVQKTLEIEAAIGFELPA